MNSMKLSDFIKNVKLSKKVFDELHDDYLKEIPNLVKVYDIILFSLSRYVNDHDKNIVELINREYDPDKFGCGYMASLNKQLKYNIIKEADSIFICKPNYTAKRKSSDKMITDEDVFSYINNTLQEYITDIDEQYIIKDIVKDLNIVQTLFSILYDEYDHRNNQFRNESLDLKTVILTYTTDHSIGGNSNITAFAIHEVSFVKE